MTPARIAFLDGGGRKKRKKQADIGDVAEEMREEMMPTRLAIGAIVRPRRLLEQAVAVCTETPALNTERIIVDSACDWGVSDPLAVPRTAALMAERGIDAVAIRQVTYANALGVYGLSGAMKAADSLEPAPIDQRTLFQGNSVLRGAKRRASNIRVAHSPISGSNSLRRNLLHDSDRNCN
jgi:hypothetical protein